MASHSCIRQTWRVMTKAKIYLPTLVHPSRATLSTSRSLREANVDLAPESTQQTPTDLFSLENAIASTPDEDPEPRLPRSVQALYLKPLRRHAQYGVPACDLQLRSYSVRNVEFFADFALRAAYYLDLPASGPTPLPRITERWTVPKSNFVHKKSQENFERITLRRLIQIQDGHPETVQVWLAFLKKHSYYGIGMKANIWEHEKLGVGKTMDISLQSLKEVIEPGWAHFGRKKNLETPERVMQIMSSMRFRGVRNGDAPLSEAKVSSA